LAYNKEKKPLKNTMDGSNDLLKHIELAIVQSKKESDSDLISKLNEEQITYSAGIKTENSASKSNKIDTFGNTDGAKTNKDSTPTGKKDYASYKKTSGNYSKKTNTQIILGDDLEYRVARIFLKQGYFVRRGINIYTIGNIDTATDIDVLAIKYSDSFGRSTIISECKSGESRPLDRVFWLSGLKNYLNASRAILVRKPTRWSIKDFAKEAGVEILDFDRITTLEDTLEIQRTEWLGYTDKKFFSNQIVGWNDILRRDEYLAEMFLTFSGEARFNEPFSAINFYLHHMRVLTKKLVNSSGIMKSLIKYLLGDATAQFVIFLMEICKASYDLSDTDRKGFIEKKLTFGELDSSLSEKIFDHAYNLSVQVASHQVGVKVEIDRSLFTIPKPDYVEDVLAYVEYLISRMHKVSQVPFACDLLIAETFVKENMDFRLKSILDSHSVVYVLQALDQYFKMLIKIKCLPSDFSIVKQL
jgi:hypothetical protein